MGCAGLRGTAAQGARLLPLQPPQLLVSCFPLLLKLTDVPLLLSGVPLSTFVSVGSALKVESLGLGFWVYSGFKLYVGRRPTGSGQQYISARLREELGSQPQRVD